jgi:spore maturation protein CgeB
MVDFLKKEYGAQFGVYGSNWGSHETGNMMGDQKREADIYRGCKIAINFSHFDYERYSSDRMFRLMASGAFCLSHRYAGIHLDFESGVDLACWDSFEHLKFQIDYYLKNEDQRKVIAEKGCKLAHEKFTFDAMISNLLKLYNGRS